VVLGGGNDIVALQQSTNPGPLGVPGAAKLKGGMDFGAGADALVFDVADDRYWNFEIEGNVTGLESARKTGFGRVGLGDLELPLSGAPLSPAEGDLFLTGHLNLGPNGVLEIASDAGRLIFGSGEDGGRGRIAAGSARFPANAESPTIYLPASEDPAAWSGRDVLVLDAGRFRKGTADIAGGVRLLSVDGQDGDVAFGAADAGGVITIFPELLGSSPTPARTGMSHVGERQISGLDGIDVELANVVIDVSGEHGVRADLDSEGGSRPSGNVTVRQTNSVIEMQENGNHGIYASHYEGHSRETGVEGRVELRISGGEVKAFGDTVNALRMIQGSGGNAFPTVEKGAEIAAGGADGAAIYVAHIHQGGCPTPMRSLESMCSIRLFRPREAAALMASMFPGRRGHQRGGHAVRNHRGFLGIRSGNLVRRREEHSEASAERNPSRQAGNARTWRRRALWGRGGGPAGVRGGWRQVLEF